ncbi:MAG: hypothetical protein WCL18_00015 [bacterium]
MVSTAVLIQATIVGESCCHTGNKSPVLISVAIATAPRTNPRIGNIKILFI